MFTHINYFGVLQPALYSIHSLLIQFNNFDWRTLLLMFADRDLFGDKTVKGVNHKLHIICIQLCALSFLDIEDMKNSRYVQTLLYFGSYLKKEYTYMTDVSVVKIHHYDHPIIIFPGSGSTAAYLCVNENSLVTIYI